MAINKISEFPKVTPSVDDKILIEKNGEGSHINLSEMPVSTPVEKKISDVQKDLNDRITALAFKPGDTTGDAELKDIRKPATGFTVPTNANAGDAVRAQVTQLDGKINELKGDLNQLKDVIKNLLPISDASIVVNSVGVTYEDGVLSLLGTGTASGGRTTKIITLTLPAGNYTFSSYDKLADFAIFVEKESDNSILAELTNTSVTSQSDTFTLNTETSVYLGVNVGQRDYDASCRIQLESGNESTSYIIPSNYHAYDEVARASIQDIESDIDDIRTNITYNVDLSNESAENKKLINSNNGTEILNQADIYGVTDFIDISSLAGLKCSITSLFGGWFGVAFYNKNREFIKGLSSTSTGAIDGAVSKVNTSIPEDAVYIRWSLLTDFVVANYPITCNENAINVVNKRLEVDDVKLIENDFSTVSVFENIGICGDSFASGEIHVGNNACNCYNLSWGQILGRKCGINVYNYSVSGYSTQSFLTSASRGLPKLLSDEAKNLYIMAFGLNDINIANYLGSISDIKSDYSQNPDTFYGNYARIIEQVQAHAPNAKIVLSTMARHFEEPQFSAFDDAIVEIANHYSIPVLITKDDPFFNSSFFEDGLVTYHPTAVLYGGMSEAYQRLFSKATITYRSYFADYIG